MWRVEMWRDGGVGEVRRVERARRIMKKVGKREPGARVRGQSYRE